MKTAIVTGASSGIGLSSAKRLITLGYRVYAIARDFEKCHFEDTHFISIPLDLTDATKIEILLKSVETKELCILINAAGVGHFAPHEELSIKEIEQMITLNLTAPLIISKLLLRDLKHNSGYIFNINSISGIQPALFGATYGATKAGLKHFGTSLFKEARKSGLKVININPDITKSAFFDDLHFEPTSDPQTYIEPEDIADIIESVLQLRPQSVITDITVEPQKFQIAKKRK